MVAKMHFLFSTDSYRPQSIKTLERLRREWSGKSVLLLLLHKYRIILIDQIDFTLSIITSAFKHQWPFVFHVEVRKLPTIYSSQVDTRMVMYHNRAAALAGIQECSSQNLRKIVVEDEKLTSKFNIDLVRLPPCHSALKPHIQWLNVALYKHADESILEKFKPYGDG